jgi:hypothetical protein
VRVDLGAIYHRRWRLSTATPLHHQFDGKMTDTGLPEIIDLTESSLHKPIVINADEDNVTSRVVCPEGTQGEKETGKSRRRPRKKEVPIEDGGAAESSTQASRNRSKERNAKGNRDPTSRQRSRSPEPLRKDTSPLERLSELFYVDTVPVRVPAPTIPWETPSDTTGEIILDLLLPEHVSVFGPEVNGERPVEIIGPTPPTFENEDFIEYLDYDDRNKVIFAISTRNLIAR